MSDRVDKLRSRELPGRARHVSSKQSLSQVAAMGLSRQAVWSYLGVFSVALLIRLVYLLEMRGSLSFSLLLGDSFAYDRWAREIAAGDWVGKGVFYQAPLYPYFLGVIYRIFGGSLMSARIVQIVIGSASCMLLAMAGTRWFSRTVGILAGLLLATYGPAAFFDALIQKSVLDLFFLSVLLLALGQLVTRFGWIPHLVAGLALGCLILTRENAAILIPLVPVWILTFFRSRPAGQRLLGIVLFAAGLLAVLLPVGVRNKVLGGEFILTTSRQMRSTGRHWPWVTTLNRHSACN